MKTPTKVRTVSSARVRKAFVEAFRTIREEAMAAAVALGFKPGNGLIEALDHARDVVDNVNIEHHHLIDRPAYARGRAAGIIWHLLAWKIEEDDPEFILELLDDLSEILPLARRLKIAA